MELWGCGEREELAVLGMRGDRGKRQIRGENLDRVAEGWKQPFILNEVRGKGVGKGETRSRHQLRDPESCAVNRRREGRAWKQEQRVHSGFWQETVQLGELS